MKKTNLDKILNEALNKALIGRNKIKQVNSNEIADFVNKHLEAINYTHSCTELVCDDNELDCPYEFTSRCTMGRCDCKPKAN